MLSDAQLKEILFRTENHITNYLEVIERYIYDLKGVRVIIHKKPGPEWYETIWRGYLNAIRYYTNVRVL